MDTHHLRNLLHPDLLRQRLETEGVPRTTLSFYRYVRLTDAETLRHTLYQEWEALGVLGRIYLSQEGINAPALACLHPLEQHLQADTLVDQGDHDQAAASRLRPGPWLSISAATCSGVLA